MKNSIMHTESPTRSSHTYTLFLEAPPERIFPLFSPILEEQWVPNWPPSPVPSPSEGDKEACVFISPSSQCNATWVVTRIDQDNHFVELLKIIPDHTVGRLEIQLEAWEENRTRATLACTHTALGPEGETFVEMITREHVDAFMKTWEKALNRHLTSGEKLPDCDCL